MRKLKDPIQWGAFMGAGLIATVAVMPQANGELVYDDQPAPVNREVISEESEGGRDTIRQVILSSEKAKASRSGAAGQALSESESQFGAFEESAPARVEVQNLSRHELLRRERVRQELRNEDILQERLESLRLRDEKRRADQLLAEDGYVKKDQEPVVEEPAPLKEEFVSSEPAYSSVSDEVIHTRSAPTAPAAAVVESIPAPVAASSKKAEEADEEELTFGIQARAGIADMVGSSGYDVRPRFSAGFGLGVGVSDNLSFEAGYSYNEYGIALAQNNPYVQNALAWHGMGFYNPNLETVAMKQNVFDMGLRVHLLGPASRLRPYIGGGAAYSRGFVNFDDRVLSLLQNQGLGVLGNDYEVTSFLAHISTGLDVRISKNVSVGANFKYYTVLTARENQALNNMAMFNPGWMNFGGFYNQLADADKQLVGGTLARTSFYSILAGVTFSF